MNVPEGEKGREGGGVDEASSRRHARGVVGEKGVVRRSTYLKLSFLNLVVEVLDLDPRCWSVGVGGSVVGSSDSSR